MKKPLLRTFIGPLALCLGLLFTFTSCEKDEASPSDTPDCRISKYLNLLNPEQYATYHYDPQNRLWQVKNYDRILRTVNTYEYNSQGQVSQVTKTDRQLNTSNEWTENVITKYTFEYNASNQVVKVYLEPGEKYVRPKAVITCEYDRSGNLTKTTNTPEDPRFSFSNEYTYKDGNCIKAVFDKGLPFQKSKVYEYDLSQEDKQKNLNKVQMLSYLNGQPINKNLLLSETISYQQATNFDGVLTYNYEFNELGFPTRIKTYFDNNLLTSILNEYDCQ